MVDFIFASRDKKSWIGKDSYVRKLFLRYDIIKAHVGDHPEWAKPEYDDSR